VNVKDVFGSDPMRIMRWEVWSKEIRPFLVEEFPGLRAKLDSKEAVFILPVVERLLRIDNEEQWYRFVQFVLARFGDLIGTVVTFEEPSVGEERR
jgi:hypothetical protein